MASQPPSRPDDRGKHLPPRDSQGHKGTFGTALIVGGCAPNPFLPTTMLGGPALAAGAALRAGAGLARLAMPAPLLIAGLTITPEATGLALPTHPDGMLHRDAGDTIAHAAKSAHAVLIGPGLGQSPTLATLTRVAITPPEPPPTGTRGGFHSFDPGNSPALILDADALNNLTTIPPDQLPRRNPDQPLLLTPHLGEYRRLSKWLGIDDPHAIAERLDAILIIKSATTIIADAERRTEIPGNQPLLATGGTGDILAGIITGLLAQKIAGGDDSPLATFDSFHLATIAVHAHQRAAALWGESRAATPSSPLTRGMLAGDLLAWIGPALEAPAALESP